MDYKKLVKSRDMREKILRILSFIPDKSMVKLQYRIKTGRNLNLKDPQRYTEKLQWYKLFYKDPIMIKCVDKYDVRQYIEEKGMGELLNKCYGVYEKADDIDFSSLPDKFVIKDTLGGGGDRVIVCKNKKNIDIEALRKRLNAWTDEKLVKSGGREWPYYEGKKHRIIIEEFLSCSDGDLPDYKFFCFQGKCFYSYVKVDYANSHEEGKLAFFDRNKMQLDAKMDYCKKINRTIKLPRNYDKMVGLAEKLAVDFPHVRVDFYDVDGRIVFGELTFYNASGYMNFDPDSFDYEMGKCFELPSKIDVR